MSDDDSIYPVAALTPEFERRLRAAVDRALASRRETRLRALLRDVVVAADRMRDNWAEGDDAVRVDLWRNLHAAAEAAGEEVYPL